jgi:hypothetical protein
MRILELPRQWREIAMVVSSVDDPKLWFSAEELEIVAAFPHEKRRREWMLSRIAEKELRSRRGAAGVRVSYSHSGPFGAAAVSDDPIGIDVELMRVIQPRAAHLFLTDEEAEAANACAIENPLLHFWSAKEAKWKQLGGALATLKRVPLEVPEVRGNGLRFDGVETIATQEAIIAIATPNRAEFLPVFL